MRGQHSRVRVLFWVAGFSLCPHWEEGSQGLSYKALIHPPKTFLPQHEPRHSHTHSPTPLMPRLVCIPVLKGASPTCPVTWLISTYAKLGNSGSYIPLRIQRKLWILFPICTNIILFSVPRVSSSHWNPSLDSLQDDL